MLTVNLLPSLPLPWAALLGLAAAALVVLLFVAGRAMPTLAPRWIRDALGARPLGRLEAPLFRDTVQRLARSAGVAEPEILLIPHPQANLFVLSGASGTPALAVTEGALAVLSPAEVEAAVGAALARAARPDLTRSTVAAGLGLGASALGGLGVVRGHEVEEQPLGWPIGIPFIALGALLARAVGGPAPCTRADLRGASISGRWEECARLLEHMEFTAHAEPMAIPAALSRLALVHPRGAPGPLSMVSLFAAPDPSAPRAALLRGAIPPGGPSRARAA